MAITNSSGQLTSTTQPCFLVSRNTDTAALGSNTTVVFNNVLFDVTSSFNTGTGGFTCPTSGKYLFTVALRFSASGAGGLGIRVIDNVGTAHEIEGGIQTRGGSGSVIINCSAGLIYSVQPNLTTGTVTVQGNSGATHNSYFAGVLLL